VLLFITSIIAHTERTILLRNLKFCWIQMKIILLDYQNNLVETSKIMSNWRKKFWYSSN